MIYGTRKRPDVMATSKPYTPPARIWRALTFADLLDAAGIASLSVSAMSHSEWTVLAAAAGLRVPSPETCALTVTILRRREDARRKLQPLIQNRRNHATSETTPALRAEH
jgi:hypothetical protein